MVYTYRTRKADSRKFRFNDDPTVNEMIDHILGREPTKFEQEVDSILQGEKDFYLEWQAKIADAATDEELKALVREILATEYSDEAKRVILGIIDRQYDLIHRIKGNARGGDLVPIKSLDYPSVKLTDSEVQSLKGMNWDDAEKFVQKHGYTYFKSLDNPMSPLRGLGYIDNYGNIVYIYWNEGFGKVIRSYSN